MAVNPYTLNMLYQKGILDYVPTELYAPTPIGTNIGMQNPYMNEAMQGNLYQNYGNATDSFTSTSFAGSGSYNNTQIGSSSAALSNKLFGDASIGKSANSVGSMFGFNGAGSQGYSTESMFGASGIGGNSQTGGVNMFGGFADAQNNVSNGFNKTVSTIAGLPAIAKGILSAGLVLLTLGFMFKGKKTKGAKGFWSKLNPVNWFKKPKPEPKKLTFAQKLNPKNWFKKNK